MPPKQKFTKEDIVEAAFNVVREQGWEALSQRSIAKKLNASIGPIYSYLKSMTNLEEAVIEKAYDLLLQYVLTPRGEDGLTHPSFGYVLFAKNEKKLFKVFFNEKHMETHKKYAPHRLWRTVREAMKDDPRYSSLTDRQKEGLHQNIVIFSYGLATLVNVSFYEFSDEEISRLIADARRMFLDGFKD